MAGAHNDRTAESGPPQEDAGSPDWTVWLRSRLERVAISERQGADTGSDEKEGTGSDEEGREAEAATAGNSTAEDAGPAADRRHSEPFLPVPEPRSDDAELALRLDWPEHPLQQALTAESLQVPASVDPAPPPPPVVARVAPAPDPTPAILAGLDSLQTAVSALPSGPDPAILAGLDSLQTAVSALPARIDAAADATGSFRSVMNDRIDEYVETVMRAAKGTSSDLEEYRRMHASSITELRRVTIDTAETLRRLTGWIEELATVQGDDERWAHAMTGVFEEMAAERRAQEDHLTDTLSSLSSLPGRLDQVEGGLREALAELADARLASEVPSRPLELDEVQLKAIALAVADLVSEMVADIVVAPPPPGPPGPRPRARKAPSPAAKATPAVAKSTSKATPGRATPAAASVAKAKPAKAKPAKAKPAKAKPAKRTAPAAKAAPGKAGTAARTKARPRRTTPIQARSSSDTRARP